VSSWATSASATRSARADGLHTQGRRLTRRCFCARYRIRLVRPVRTDGHEHLLSRQSTRPLEWRAEDGSDRRGRGRGTSAVGGVCRSSAVFAELSIPSKQGKTVRRHGGDHNRGGRGPRLSLPRGEAARLGNEFANACNRETGPPAERRLARKPPLLPLRFRRVSRGAYGVLALDDRAGAFGRFAACCSPRTQESRGRDGARGLLLGRRVVP
jgi:hypothetical protein